MKNPKAHPITEDQIEAVIMAIPGSSIMSKLWGAVTVAMFVLLRAGVTKQKMLDVMAGLYDKLAPMVEKFPDLEEDYNLALEESEMKVGMINKVTNEVTFTDQVNVIAPSSSSTSTFSEDDFL